MGALSGARPSALRVLAEARNSPLPRDVFELDDSGSLHARREVAMALSRRTLWIGAALVLAIVAVVLIAVFSGDGSAGGGVGY